MQSNLKQIAELRKKYEAEKLMVEMNNDFIKPYGNNWFNNPENNINNSINPPIKLFYSPVSQNFMGKEAQTQRFDESANQNRLKPQIFQDERRRKFSQNNEELPLPLMSDSMIMPVFSDIDSSSKQDDKYIALIRKQNALEQDKAAKDEEILNLKKLLLEKQSNSKSLSEAEPLFKTCISEELTFDPSCSKAPIGLIYDKNASKPDPVLIQEEEGLKKTVYHKKNGFTTSRFLKNSSDSRNNTPVSVSKKVEKKQTGMNSNQSNSNNNNLNGSQKNTPYGSLNSINSYEFERNNVASSGRGEGKKQFNFCKLKNSEAKIESSNSLAVINIKFIKFLNCLGRN